MHFTRRYFLQSTGALSAYLGVAPAALLNPTAPAATVRVNKGKTLVVIFLRGGADGLNLVVPHGDPAYEELRRSTRIAAPGTAGRDNSAIDLDGFFGRLDLDRRIKLQIHAAKLSPVGGSLLFRGLDAALGQMEMAGWRMLSD